MTVLACSLQFGRAQLAILVGVGLGEPFGTALFGTGLAIGLVDETVLVHIHPLEKRLMLGRADTTITIGIHPAHEAIPLMAAVMGVPAVTTIATTRMSTRHFVT